MVASRSAGSNPAKARTAITTTTITATPNIVLRCRAGSGLGISRPIALRCLRPRAYCTSPKAMPTAARPNP